VNQIQYHVYDFASSARVDRPLWLAFHNWMEKFAKLFVEHWSSISSTPIQATPLTIDAGEFETLQTRWNKPAYGVEVGFKEESTTGLLVIDRLELLRLLMDILGDSAGAELVDRELTSVETSLCEMIFEQTASVIGQSWPDQESLTFSLGETNNQPNRSRMFAFDKNLLTSGLLIQLPETTVQLQLLLAKDETVKLLGVDQQAKKLNPNNRVSQDKIAELCVQVSAGLGHSELGMSELVSIAVGDIIVLDQSVEDPVVIFANDEPIFSAWPGRIDKKQALKIVSSLPLKS
jgi:flagellar motor switch protein FliM